MFLIRTFLFFPSPLSRHIKIDHHHHGRDEQEVKGESGSIVTNKLNNFKNKMINKVRRNKKDGGQQLAITSKKFSSNGSLLSHNGLKAAYSEPDMQLQGGNGVNGAGGINGAGGEPYVNIIEGKMLANDTRVVVVVVELLVHERNKFVINYKTVDSGYSDHIK